MSKMLVSLVLIISVFAWIGVPVANAQVTNPQQGSIGLQGTIPTDPPTEGATITFPSNGQVFSDIPIFVRGICPAGLLIKIFKNQVFAGSAQCRANGTFELQIDLFSGRNDLVATVFDALDQAGPDSNTVTVTFNDSQAQEGVEDLILTSNFATRGADPGAVLRWPLALAGGVGPYAISVDWGDGETSLETLNFAGNFAVTHVYEQPGVYRVIVKAEDSRDDTAFIQLVAIANGPSSQDSAGDFGSGAGGADGSGGADGVGSQTGIRTQIITWPIYIMMFFAVSTFWIGRRYEIRRIRHALQRNERIEF